MAESLNLADALLVTVIGMLIVFFGLTVLIFLIKLLVKVTGNMGAKKSTQPAATAPVVETVPEETEEDDSEIIAVITAAVYAMLDEEKKDGSGFVVRHIRRVNHAPAWQRAGRDEQIYSHY